MIKIYKSIYKEESTKYYYHVTKTSLVKEILKNGIKPYKGKVYLTDDINFALEIGTTLHELRYNYQVNLSIIQIESKIINGLKKDPEFPSGGYYITYRIPPNFLKDLGDLNKLEDSVLNEKLEIPLEVEDEILGGRFKNKRMIVKGFGKDSKNQPLVKTNKGEIPLFKFRIAKLMPEK